jgi:hypothetical protein
VTDVSWGPRPLGGDKDLDILRRWGRTEGADQPFGDSVVAVKECKEAMTLELGEELCSLNSDEGSRRIERVRADLAELGTVLERERLEDEKEEIRMAMEGMKTVEHGGCCKCFKGTIRREGRYRIGKARSRVTARESILPSGSDK